MEKKQQQMIILHVATRLFELKLFGVESTKIWYVYTSSTLNPKQQNMKPTKLKK